MGENRLKLDGVNDIRVLEAMRKVDRRLFLPEDVKRFACDDRPLPIGLGQTISQPYVVALMSELLELRGTERVLEIGTGSGYQAAILGVLAREVFSLEIVPELAQRSAQLLKELGYANVLVQEGDGAKGWPEKAPFDAIIVTCAPEHVPAALAEQLTEGGRLVIPVGQGDRRQMLNQYQKVAGSLVERAIVPVSFVPMTGGLQ
jgi:protein-L-isoaspartate(D-aspartate) O-methyltransferase